LLTSSHRTAIFSADGYLFSFWLQANNKKRKIITKDVGV
jgi:hypothetical protein